MAEPWGALNPALTAWRNGVNQRFPKRGTASDGARADKLHGSTSEHQEDVDGTVDAFDMDVNLLGSRNEAGTAEERALIEALKLDFEADSRAQLWIHQREIANREIDDWRERDYNGKNAHDHHVHWQSRQAQEKRGGAWLFVHTDALLKRMEEDDMPTVAEIAEGVWEHRVPAGYASAPTVQAQTAAKAATLTEVATRRLPETLAEIQAEQARQALLLDTILAKLDGPPAGS